MHATLHHSVEGFGEARPQLTQAVHLAVNHPHERLVRRVCLKGAGKRQRFVKDGAEREQVRAAIHLAGSGLLWRHVAELSFDHSIAGLLRRIDHFCDPEVRDQYTPVETQEQVLRRDVSMHEVVGPPVFIAGLVGRMQAFCRLGDDPCCQRWSERRCGRLGVAEQFDERQSEHELHHDVGRTVLLSEFEGLHDIGVGDARSNARLRQEGTQRHWVAGGFVK